MRIVIVSAVFPPILGGMCTVAAAEAAELARSHDVCVYTLATTRADADAAVDANISYGVVRLRPWVRVWISGFVPQLLWHLRREKIVYAHVPAYGWMTMLLLWKWIFNGRLVVTLHMDPVGVGWVSYVFRVKRFIFAALLRSADAIRVSSECFAQSSLLRGCADKMHVIPFGVSTDLLQVVRTGYSDHPIFLFVGRLSQTHYFKGVELLIRAFADVAEKNTTSELWIVGDGDERVRYEQITLDLHISQRVCFLGALSDGDLAKTYPKASALVLPSLDRSETFGLVCLEAMACGVPVIASRLPGVASLVMDGVTGMLVEPGSKESLEGALWHVINNHSRWILQSDAARRRAAEYGSWKSVVKKIETLLY